MTFDLHTMAASAGEAVSALGTLLGAAIFGFVSAWWASRRALRRTERRVEENGRRIDSVNTLRLSDVNDLLRRVSNLQVELSGAQAELATMKQQRDRLQSLYEESRTMLQASKAENEALRSQLGLSEQKIQRLELRIQELETKQATASHEA